MNKKNDAKEGRGPIVRETKQIRFGLSTTDRQPRRDLSEDASNTQIKRPGDEGPG